MKLLHYFLCASYFNFNATVGLQAGDQSLASLIALAGITGYRVCFALAICEDLVSCNAFFVDQVGLDSFSAA